LTGSPKGNEAIEVKHRLGGEEEKERKAKGGREREKLDETVIVVSESYGR
jgi:hypothetical protein